MYMIVNLNCPVSITIIQIQLLRSEMESDLSYPKSRAFNVFFRFLQLGLSLGCGVFISQLVEKSCIDNQYRLIELLSLVVILVSFIGLLVVKCSKNHPKVGFILLFLIDVGLLVAILVFAIQNYQNAQNCALTKVTYNYFILQICLYIVSAIMILTFSFFWIQRYSNSPGNLAWPALFIIADQSQSGLITIIVISIALLTLIISLLTIISNIFASCKGITSGVKKFISFAWIFDLILMLLCEGLAIFGYITLQKKGDSLSFGDSVVKIILQIFILVNIIDLVFWLFGLITLQYENGDTIRENLVNFGKNKQFEEQSDVNDYEYQKGDNLGQIK